MLASTGHDTGQRMARRRSQRLIPASSQRPDTKTNPKLKAPTSQRKDTKYIAAAKMSQYLWVRHGEISSARKDVLRPAAKPTCEGDVRLKKIGNCLLGALSCLLDFRWRTKTETSRLDCCVDSHRSGGVDTSKKYTRWSAWFGRRCT